MRHDPKSRAGIALRLTAAVAVLTTFAAALWLGRIQPASAQVKPNAKKAQAAFLEASKVFFSPRCTNCHAAAEVPTQGDNAKPHDEGIARGKAGRGLEAGLACTDCHLAQNTEGEGMPPGVPDWRMPPAETKMIFHGRTPAELCRQLKDPKQNSGKTKLPDAVHHMESDPLVVWAWSPGNNRTVPPLPHKEFMALIKTWVDNGGACPE